MEPVFIEVTESREVYDTRSQSWSVVQRLVLVNPARIDAVRFDETRRFDVGAAETVEEEERVGARVLCAGGEYFVEDQEQLKRALRARR